MTNALIVQPVSGNSAWIDRFFDPALVGSRHDQAVSFRAPYELTRSMDLMIGRIRAATDGNSFIDDRGAFVRAAIYAALSALNERMDDPPAELRTMLATQQLESEIRTRQRMTQTMQHTVEGLSKALHGMLKDEGELAAAKELLTNTINKVLTFEEYWKRRYIMEMMEDRQISLAAEQLGVQLEAATS